ncbi:hypothetical protein O181_026541 [Austropuccinia psidii MF-1]|uniref:Zinc finger ZPR1-type domain-containing protein n=1 Tax=Austropuccinia psidii MF-1 TaxID=1389203 RepID=A0A9Q3CKM2_9BASI|nr:hypothetical protein [Austropuccinia psidii MF-1]
MSIKEDQSPNQVVFEPIGQVAERIKAESVASDSNPNLSEPDSDHQDHNPNGVDAIESLCMNCNKNGTTRILLTSIPFFREVIIVSFKCPHCHHSNNSIQSAGQIQPRGSIYSVKNLIGPKDLNRQVIKSEHCIVRFKELQLEIPKGMGKMTTVEGLIKDTIDDLSFNQPVRLHTDPLVYEKIQELLDNLSSVIESNFGPISIELEDISGNSFIEAIDGLKDSNWSKKEFIRTAQQNAELGLGLVDSKDSQLQTTGLTDDFQGEDPEEIYSFPSTCGSCGHTLDTRMKKLNIPHFKEVIVMSTNCAHCGYKDNEVKAATEISKLGTKLILEVNDKEDLSRDILKSETAALMIPEIELELNPGTLGGRFTTLEGLLSQIYEELEQKVFARGDSAPSDHLVGSTNETNQSQITIDEFLEKLKKMINVQVPYSIIIDDPLSNSYIQNIYAPDPDPSIKKIEYERTFEQNDELGLNDMKTENY